MKIIELRAENVKRLTAVDIKPDGSVVVVGGKNGAGKSSLLDSIVYALSGAASLPGKPVRKGEEKAEIEIKLDGGLTVRRRIHEGGKTDLEIKQTIDGVTSKLSKPQDVLNSLYGTIAFDPLAFTRLRPQEQVDMLRKLVGVDVSDIDAEVKRIFDERTAVNRDVKALESQVQAAPKFDEAPADEVSAREILDAIEDMRVANAKVDEADRVSDAAAHAAEKARMAVGHQKLEVDRLAAQLKLAESRLEELESEAQAAQLAADAAVETAANLQRQDDSELRKQLDSAEETNRKVRANKSRAALVERLAAANEQSADLTKQLEQLRQDRIKRMDSAAWPVEGLGFTEDGVVYNGLPFDQCSSAEQLRIATSIGLAQHPKLRVFLMREGSWLDEDGMAVVAELAAEHDAQIWIERVGKGHECSVIIEDGTVAGAKQQKELVAS